MSREREEPQRKEKNLESELKCKDWAGCQITEHKTFNSKWVSCKWFWHCKSDFKTQIFALFFCLYFDVCLSGRWLCFWEMYFCTFLQTRPLSFYCPNVLWPAFQSVYIQQLALSMSRMSEMYTRLYIFWPMTYDLWPMTCDLCHVLGVGVTGSASVSWLCDFVIAGLFKVCLYFWEHSPISPAGSLCMCCCNCTRHGTVTFFSCCFTFAGLKGVCFF